MNIKNNFDALGRIKSKLQFPKPLDAAPRLNLQSLDSFTPSKSPIIGMPDPAKYPDWKPGRKAPSTHQDRDRSPLPTPGHHIMGGDDSPCFVNGEVMTIREAKRRFG